jgi:hypothetical protein
MESKPAIAAGYSTGSVQLVRAANLYIATKIGDLRDDVVIVVGLVPSLIVSQTEFPAGRPLHVGTMDVDLGLAIERALQPSLRRDWNSRSKTGDSLCSKGKLCARNKRAAKCGCAKPVHLRCSRRLPSRVAVRTKTPKIGLRLNGPPPRSNLFRYQLELIFT